MTRKFLFALFVLVSLSVRANFILLPMDETTQQNHLKAYGITYWVLDKQYKASWLLNYRGGSFLLPDAPEIRRECQIRGVSFEVLTDAQANQILDEISSGLERPFQAASVTDRREAICLAVLMAKPRDTVLIAGKGHETYQEARGERRHFDDREEARAALELKKRAARQGG